MKKGILLFTVVLVFLGFILSSCASIKILTPGAIDDDIAGLQNLANCQYFISEDVTLNFLSDNRQTGINESSGIVEAQRIITRRTIYIASSTPGILQTRNSAGKTLDGYEQHTGNNGREYLSLYILFEEDDDNAIVFQAFYDDKDDRFELYTDEIEYGGLTYKVTYYGDEFPYLKYKLLERTREQNEARKVTGRRVGS